MKRLLLVGLLLGSQLSCAGADERALIYKQALRINAAKLVSLALGTCLASSADILISEHQPLAGTVAMFCGLFIVGYSLGTLHQVIFPSDLITTAVES